MLADRQRIQKQLNLLVHPHSRGRGNAWSVIIENLKNKLLIWKSETDAFLEHEIQDHTREVEDFNYDKFFKEGDTKRVLIDEFNSNNPRHLNLEKTKAKIASLEYI